jgi:hypothetical protein
VKGDVTDEQIAVKYLALRTSAKDRGIEFSLSLKKLTRLMRQKYCHYTGVIFIEGDELYCRTIDRVNNNKGYTDTNTVACTKKINSKKADLTIEDIELLYKGIQEFK